MGDPCACFESVNATLDASLWPGCSSLILPVIECAAAAAMIECRNLVAELLSLMDRTGTSALPIRQSTLLTKLPKKYVGKDGGKHEERSILPTHYRSK